MSTELDRTAVATEVMTGQRAAGAIAHRASWATASVVGGLWLIGVLRLLYTTGTGEHDVFMMAAGVVRGQTAGALNEFCYGTPLQFGFYYAFRVLTSMVSLTSEQVLLIINVGGALSSLAIAYLLFRILSALLGVRARAELAVLLLVSTPMYYYLISYGHPFHFGVVLLLAAWLMLLAGFDALPRPKGWVLVAGATVLQTLAFVCRLEQPAMLATLLWGVLCLRRRHSWLHVFTAAASGAASFVMFVAAASLFGRSGGLQGADPGARGGLGLLLTTLEPRAVVWGVAHIVVEVGLPLLAIAAIAAYFGARKDRLALLVVGVTAILPTLAIYIGNPSPTRHLYLLAVGLGVFVAALLPDAAVVRVRSFAVPILAFNLVLPWMVGAVDSGPRSTVSYNVLERTDRNRAQIAESAAVYSRLTEDARSAPVVVFGGWVHIAQLAARMANDSSITFEPTELPGEVYAFRVRTETMELYLVETYDREFIRRGIAAIRAQSPGLRCVSLVTPEDANDLNLAIPASMSWWS